MKKVKSVTKTLLAAAILSYGAMSTSTYAQQTKSSTTISLADKSVLGTGFMPSSDPIIKSGISIEKEHMNINILAEYLMSESKIREIDFGLTVPLIKKDPLHVDLYLGYFSFPSSVTKDARELGMAVVTNKLPLDMSTYFGKIFGPESGKGFTSNISLSKKLQIKKDLTTKFASKLSYNNNYFTKSNGLSHVVLSLTTNYDFSKETSISFELNRQYSFNNFNGTFPNTWFTSLTLKKGL